MLGDELVERIEVVNHDARDPSTLTYLGEHGNGVPVRSTRAGSRPTCGSRPASSSRTSSPASAAGRSSSRPAWPGWTRCSCSTTPPASATRRRPGASSNGNPVHDDIRAAAAAAPPHFAFDVILNREQRVIEAFAGELGPMHAAACEAAQRFAMRRGAAAVRRRGDEQLRLSARPEPLPGGQGHVGGGEGGQAGRPDRLRGRVPRRLPRPRLLPRAARAARPRASSCARSSSPTTYARPVAGADPIQHPGPRAGRRAHGHLSDDELRAVHLEQTDDIARDGRGRGRARDRVRPARGPADDRLRRLTSDLKFHRRRVRWSSTSRWLPRRPVPTLLVHKPFWRPGHDHRHRAGPSSHPASRPESVTTAVGIAAERKTIAARERDRGRPRRRPAPGHGSP